MRFLNIPLALLLFCLLVISSCKPTKSDQVNPDIIEIDILAAQDDQRPFPLSKIVKDVEIVPLENSVESYFVNNLSTVVGEDYILFVCNYQNKIYIFNRDGSFSHNVGRMGKGPGEFMNLSHCIFDADQKHIIILDQKSQKLIKYSCEGDFVLEKKISDDLVNYFYDEMCEIDEDHFALIVRRPMTPVEGFHSVQIFDFDLNHVGDQLPRANDGSLCLPGLTYHRFSRGSSGTLFYEAVFDTVYQISSSGPAKPIYHLKISDNHLQLDDFRFRASVPWASRATVWSIHELDDYVIINASNCMKSFLVVYEKNSGETYSVNTKVDCNEEDYSLENDIYGLEPVRMYFLQAQDKINTFFFRPQVDILMERIDVDCLRRQEVSRPDLRDQLADMMDEMTGEENTVLQIMHLR